MKSFSFITFFLLIAVSAYITWLKPSVNWDMLAYAGVVYSHESNDAAQLHALVYDEAKQQLDSVSYRLLTSQNTYRSRCFLDVEFFNQQLPFYSEKPLYIFFLLLIHKAGASVYCAMRWLTVTSYFFIGVLVFVWLRNYFRDVWSLIAALVVMNIPVVRNLGSLLTPDTLSTLVVLTSCYLLVEKKNHRLAFFLLLLSIFIRLDNLIFLVAFVLFYSWKNFYSISRIEVAAWALAGIATYFIILKATNGYGWMIAFQHSVIDMNVPPVDLKNFTLQPIQYFQKISEGMEMYWMKWLIAILNFSFLYFLWRRKNLFLQKSYYTTMLIAMAAVTVMKFLIIPVFDERYYAVPLIYSLICWVMLIIPQKKSDFQSGKEYKL